MSSRLATLVESKLDVLLQQSELDAATQQRIRDLDKRLTVQNKAKYAAYLVKYFEEVDIVELINEFDRLYKRLDKKDIYQYDIEELRKVLQLSKETKTDREIKSEGAKLVFENDKVRVYHILNKDASCMYGAGTKWCTTAAGEQNMFKYYHVGHNLYYILSKYRDKEDNLYKVAMTVDASGTRTLYNAQDDVIKATALRDEGIPGL